MVETRSKNLRIPDGGSSATVWHTGDFNLFFIDTAISKFKNQKSKTKSQKQK